MAGDFKWRHFEGEIILWAVRWYCKYGISYREMEERGVHLDHSTLFRWVQRYASEIEKRLRWAWRRAGWTSCWHVDETYIKVRGQWIYLYRAVYKQGHTIDFYLSPTRVLSHLCLSVIKSVEQPHCKWATRGLPKHPHIGDFPRCNRTLYCDRTRINATHFCCF